MPRFPELPIGHELLAIFDPFAESSEASPTEEKPVAISIRFPKLIHDQLRRIAYEQRVSITASSWRGSSTSLKSADNMDAS